MTNEIGPTQQYWPHSNHSFFANNITMTMLVTGRGPETSKLAFNQTVFSPIWTWNYVMLKLSFHNRIYVKVSTTHLHMKYKINEHLKVFISMCMLAWLCFWLILCLFGFGLFNIAASDTPKQAKISYEPFFFVLCQNRWAQFLPQHMFQHFHLIFFLVQKQDQSSDLNRTVHK